MKRTNLGVQLFPLLLIASGFGFRVLGDVFQSVSCFLLALVMWLILYGEEYRNQ